MLLIQRDREEWGECEIKGSEVGVAIGAEEGAGGGEIMVLEEGGGGGDVDLPEMCGPDNVDHLIFNKGKVVAEANGFIAQEVDHLLLGERREEEAKLYFGVAVGGVEACCELTVGHNGIAELIVEVTLKFLEFGDRFFHAPFIESPVVVG